MGELVAHASHVGQIDQVTSFSILAGNRHHGRWQDQGSGSLRSILLRLASGDVVPLQVVDSQSVMRCRCSGVVWP